jgi:hypothetical protein
MFRTISKKKRGAARITTQQNETEEEEDTKDSIGIQQLHLLQRLKHKSIKKQRSTIVRSGGGTRAPKQQRRLGYGDATTDAENDTEPNADSQASLYDAEALKQLQAEQQQEMFAAPENEIPIEQQQQQQQDETVVLSGDDALRMFQKNNNSNDDVDDPSDYHVANDTVDRNKQDVLNKNNNNMHYLDDSNWEDQIARRAGLSLQQQQSRTNSKQPQHYTSNDKHNTTTVLQQFQQHIQSTLVHMKEQQQDLLQALSRRQQELIHTQSTRNQQLETVATVGHALEAYQQLRFQCANWAGAVRHLNVPMAHVQEALFVLAADEAAAQAFNKDATITVLAQHECLECVIGRQPASISTPIATVDEFGRNVAVQQQRQRSQQTLESFYERRVALQRALHVPFETLDAEYAQFQSLVGVFQTWKQQFMDDYKHCYAPLSLGDLASVLMQAELCATYLQRACESTTASDPTDPTATVIDNNWVAVLQTALKDAVIDEAGVERILQKAVAPFITGLLDKAGYTVWSTPQTKSLSDLWKHAILTIAPSNSQELRDLRARMIAYIQTSLEDIAIPIVKRETSLAINGNDELKTAIGDATNGQVKRIQTVILDLVVYWTPILEMESSFVILVLDFISTKFLYLLSSLKDYPQLDESPANVFLVVYTQLRASTKWLDDPNWMLESMPIRAAATAFGTDDNTKPTSVA